MEKVFAVDPRLRSMLAQMATGDLFNKFLAIYRDPVLQFDERHATHDIPSVSLDRHSTIRSNGDQEASRWRLGSMCCIMVVLIN